MSDSVNFVARDTAKFRFDIFAVQNMHVRMIIYSEPYQTKFYILYLYTHSMSDFIA